MALVAILLGGLITVLSLPTGEAAEKGETIVYVMGAEPHKLDPPNQVDNMSETVVRHIHDNLVMFDEKLNRVPGLATSWTVSKDQLTWTFKLRKGVKFHDGTPFNAAAVKYNLDRLTNPTKTTRRTALYAPFIKSVEVVDDYTIKIVSEKPFGPILAHFAHGAGGIVSPAALEKYGDDIALRPVGTGPYRFVEWVPGDHITLERNKEHWGGVPKVEKIIFKFVKEDASRVVMLETGEADLAIMLPPIEIPRLEKNPKIQVIKAGSIRVIYIGMNVQKKPFDNVKFRQALNYAVDKEAIVKNILRGMGSVADSALAPGTWGYSPTFKYKYDPARAKALLKEAGIPEGTKVKLWTPEGRYVADRAIAEAVQGYLSAIGLNVELRKWEWAAYLSTLAKKPEEAEQELFLLGWAPSTGDGDWVLRPLFHTDSFAPKVNNYTYYSNKKVDELIVLGMTTADQKKRFEIYKEAQKLIMQDAPWVFLHNMDQTVGVKKGLKGVVVSPLELVLVRSASFK